MADNQTQAKQEKATRWDLVLRGLSLNELIRKTNKNKDLAHVTPTPPVVTN